MHTFMYTFPKTPDDRPKTRFSTAEDAIFDPRRPSTTRGFDVFFDVINEDINAISIPDDPRRRAISTPDPRRSPTT